MPTPLCIVRSSKEAAALPSTKLQDTITLRHTPPPELFFTARQNPCLRLSIFRFQKGESQSPAGHLEGSASGHWFARRPHEPGTVAPPASSQYPSAGYPHRHYPTIVLRHDETAASRSTNYRCIDCGPTPDGSRDRARQFQNDGFPGR